MFPVTTIQRYLLPLFVAVYVVLSLYIMAIFMPASSLGVNFTWSGPVRPPVAYRVLVPMVTDIVDAGIPDAIAKMATPSLIGLRDTLTGRSLLMIKPNVELPAPIQDGNIFGTFIKMTVVFGTLLAFVWMVYTLAAAFFPQSRAYALFAPVVFLLLLPVFVMKHAYTYDFAELFFSCATFYLLYKQRWNWYLACLALATLNKETSVFVIIFFLIWFYQRLPRETYMRLVWQQIAIYAVIEGTIMWYFSYRTPLNRGTMGEHFLGHIFHTFGYEYPQVAAMALTVILITYRWADKPLFLRGGLWLFPANLVAYLLFCNTGEYRDLYWAMPVPVLLATHTLIQLANIENHPIFHPITSPAGGRTTGEP